MTSSTSAQPTALTGSTTGFELDIHDAFSSFAIYYEKKQIPWFERSWGPLLYSFDSFLSFGWSTLVVVNRDTGKAHIVIQQKSVGAFAKMVKTKFYEELPKLPNPLPIIPSVHTIGPIRNISTQEEYNRLHATLRAVEFDALKERVMAGDYRSVKGLWDSRRFTFLTLNFEWWEKNPTLILETGTASMRCAHIDAAGIWPPVPDANYRRSHLVVTPHNSKSLNLKRPNHSAGYALGSSYLSDSVGLIQYLSSVIASIASPDSKEVPNTLVLVGHDIGETLHRLREMSRTVVFPSNALVVDLALLERSVFRSQPRTVGSTSFTGRDSKDCLTLRQTLGLLHIPLFCELGNAGNDAFYTLVALQCLLDPKTYRPQPHYPQPQTFGQPKPISRTTSATSLALARPAPSSAPPMPNSRRNSSTGAIPTRSSPLATQAPVIGPTPSRPIRTAPPSAFAQPASNGPSSSSSSAKSRDSSSSKPHARSNSLPPAGTAPPSTPRLPSSSRTSSTPKPPSAFAPPPPSDSSDPATTTPKARRRTSFLGRMLSSSTKKDSPSSSKSSKRSSVQVTSPSQPVDDPFALNRPTGTKPAVLTEKKDGGKDAAARAASDKMEAMEAYARKWDGLRLEDVEGKKREGQKEEWEFV